MNPESKSTPPKKMFTVQTYRVCDQQPACGGDYRPAALCSGHCEAAETRWTATAHQADTTSSYMQGHLVAVREHIILG